MIFLPIPSTRGPIAIRPAQRSGGNTAEIRRDGDYRPLEISADYRAMAAAGLIGRRGGRDLPDLVLTHDIDNGASWRLPVALFDRLRRDGRRTVADAEAATAAVFATGALGDDGRIEAHDYGLDLKWRSWTAAVPPALPTLVLLPPSPDRDALARRLAADADHVHVECVDDLAAARTALRRWIGSAASRGRAEAVAGHRFGRTRTIAAAVGLLATVVGSAIWAGVNHASNGAPSDRRSTAEAPTPAPAPMPSPTPTPEATVTAIAPVEPPSPPEPAPRATDGVAVAALETVDGSPCPSVELDATAFRATQLPIDAASTVFLPRGRTVCGIELAFRPDASAHAVVTPELRRRALLTRLSDGRLRLRHHAGVAIGDLVVELARGDGAPILLRFAVQ